MKKSLFLWLFAFVITVFSAWYQRVTGPTYPLSDEVEFASEVIHYSLDRSHGGEGDHSVKIIIKNVDVEGRLHWKRFKTNDDWSVEVMERNGQELTGSLQHQPPAGKIVYQIKLLYKDEVKTIPAEPVVIRFKGDVPALILIPHVIFIFCAMLFSTRTGLEYFNSAKNYKLLTLITFIVLLIGGLIFGPITQLYAFGELWTGIPFGYDLTDNKTLIAFIGWLIALVSVYKSKKPARWIIFAAILMFIIFLIPHSLLGSELDYNKID